MFYDATLRMLESLYVTTNSYVIYASDVGLILS